jgi:hypothetical protein
VNIKDLIAGIPERVYYLIAGFATLLILWGAYSFYSDARLLEQKIGSRQRELSRIIALKDTYLSYRNRTERVQLKKAGGESLSLGLIEGMVSKNFKSGKLNILRPSILKEQKGKAEAVIELKVSGTALSEVIAFVNALETAGITLRKFQLTLPQNQELIDLYLVVTGR